MRPRLRALAAQQGGLITRTQALDAGYTERELRTLTAVHGPWVIVRRGVYAERELWDALTGYDEQAGLRDKAVHLTMRTDHLMSHDSAARAQGIPLLRPRHELSHITREGVGGSRTERGVKHHLTRLGLLNTAEVDGMLVTGPARTAVDLGREHGFTTGLVACDAVLHQGLRTGLDKDDLWAVTRTMWCWPGITRAKAAIRSADAGAESPGETLLRNLVTELGIGEPETQFAIRIASGVVWIDLRVGCHLFEFDGRIKFRSIEHGGVADRAVEDVVWDERERQREVCAEGLGMSRVTWDELFGAMRAKTLARLAGEYAVTLARFGDVLPPHLAVFAERMRGRRRSA